MVIGRLVLPRLMDRVRHLPISEGILATAIVVALIFAWAAEVVGGIAAITGAFLAGILLAPTSVRHDRKKACTASHTLSSCRFSSSISVCMPTSGNCVGPWSC